MVRRRFSRKLRCCCVYIEYHEQNITINEIVIPTCFVNAIFRRFIGKVEVIIEINGPFVIAYGGSDR